MFNDNMHYQNFESLLNIELFKISEWLKINKLSLNVVKSKYIIFKKKENITYSLTLKIDNVDIEQVTDLHFLVDLIIDTNLNWKYHTENISNAYSKQ